MCIYARALVKLCNQRASLTTHSLHMSLLQSVLPTTQAVTSALSKAPDAGIHFCACKQNSVSGLYNPCKGYRQSMLLFPVETSPSAACAGELCGSSMLSAKHRGTKKMPWLEAPDPGYAATLSQHKWHPFRQHVDFVVDICVMLGNQCCLLLV